MAQQSAKNQQAVVILGATSAIARATAQAFAADGWRVTLAGRDGEEVDAIASDIAVRYGVTADALSFDAMDFYLHPVFFDECVDLLGDSLEGVVLCYGAMSDQEAAQADPELARRIIDTNYTSAVSLLERFAAHFESRRRGFICGVTSVAADRGRQSNYIYGSAKAGLTTFLSGMRARLFKAGVQVTTVKPGFVDTAMTWGLPGLFLVADPRDVGRSIRKAVARRKNTVYVPWFWWGIMSIIKAIPEWQFKRMKL